MRVLLTAFATTLAVASAAPIAEAHHCHHNCDVGKIHHATGKSHHGPRPLGYHRKGPVAGPGFRFATYRGDPFAHDDYYDGNNCYYLHHKDFCYPRTRWRMSFDDCMRTLGGDLCVR